MLVHGALPGVLGEGAISVVCWVGAGAVRAASDAEAARGELLLLRVEGFGVGDLEAGGRGDGGGGVPLDRGGVARS